MKPDPPDISFRMDPSEQERSTVALARCSARRAREDVRAQFDDCFRAHYTEVLAYALRRVGERGAAEDVAAEVFAVAWRRRAVVPADPLPWLFGVARHVIQNEARSHRRRSRLLSRATGEPVAVAADHADSVPERLAIIDALGRLSERDREVLCLAAWDGLDARRAAAALGCSRGAYTLRLHRARRRLAKELTPSGHVDGGDEVVPAAEVKREEVA